MAIQKFINTFNPNQREMFDIMVEHYKHQFRVPTGVGKGYAMIGHILYSIVDTNYRNFTIASHRLSLNNQHLSDLINYYIEFNLIGKVKFLTIGSQVLDISEFFSRNSDLKVKFNNHLYDFNEKKSYRVNQDDIFLRSMRKNDIKRIIKENNSNNIKTVIITTYNSLDKLNGVDLDILYLDEAHILASEKNDTDFRKSYESVIAKKTFFFSATPKDVQEDLLKEDGGSEIFLMNNKEIFGESYEVSFAECVKAGYIVGPIIHVAHPKDIDNGVNYDAIENKAKFVKDTFESHSKWVKEVSSRPDEIAAKMLVRCESVPAMWEMRKMLSTQISDDIIICAGASYNDFGGSENHIFDGEWIRNRDVFVAKVQSVPDTKRMIVLNFDIFSEGINVHGFTGVMFLQGKLPTIPKTTQNTGRTTRLHPIDRKALINGDITVGSSGWVKPNSAVIIPYWDDESKYTKNSLVDFIMDLRGKDNFNAKMIVSYGDDVADSDENPIDGLNNPEKSNKKYKIIQELTQEIEKLELEQIDSKEQEYVDSLSNEERIKYILEKEMGIEIS